MTEMVTTDSGTVRQPIIKQGMYIKHRLKRILGHKTISICSVTGNAVINPPNLNAVEMDKIRQAPEIQINFIQPNGIYIGLTNHHYER